MIFSYISLFTTILQALFTLVIAVPDNRGKEFIVAIGENYPVSRYESMELFITTEEDEVEVNVSVPLISSTYPPQTVKVYKNNITKIEIAKNIRMSGLALEDKGVLIQSSVDVTVYATNKVSKSSDAMMILPTDVLGTLYFGASYHENPPYKSWGPQVGVIATQNSTQVNFTLPSNRNVGTWFVYNGQTVNDSHNILSIVLDKFQTFQLQVENDLTGVKIESDKPVAMVTGNMRTYIVNSGSSDHIEDMIPAVSTWGRKHVTVPFAERTGGDVFRLIGSAPNTTVSVSNNTGVTNYTLDIAGGFIQLDIPSDQYLYIESDKAILVVQYCKTGKHDGANTDPMMTYIPPVEQYDNKYPLATVEAVASPYNNYISVVIESQHIDGLTLNGEPILNQTYVSDHLNTTWGNLSYFTANWTVVGKSGYSANTLFIPHGAYVLSHTSPIVSFGAFMYGQVIYESYGYPAGSRYAPTGDYCMPTNTTSSDGIDNDCDGRVDEELLNGEDDDGDGRIDEDIVIAPTTTPTPTETTSKTEKVTTTTMFSTTTVPETTTTASETTTTVQETTTPVPETTTTALETTTTTTTAIGTTTTVHETTTTVPETITTVPETTTTLPETTSITETTTTALETTTSFTETTTTAPETTTTSPETTSIPEIITTVPGTTTSIPETTTTVPETTTYIETSTTALAPETTATLETTTFLETAPTTTPETTTKVSKTTTTTHEATVVTKTTVPEINKTTMTIPSTEISLEITTTSAQMTVEETTFSTTSPPIQTTSTENTSVVTTGNQTNNKNVTLNNSVSTHSTNFTDGIVTEMSSTTWNTTSNFKTKSPYATVTTVSQSSNANQQTTYFTTTLVDNLLASMAKQEQEVIVGVSSSIGALVIVIVIVVTSVALFKRRFRVTAVESMLEKDVEGLRGNTPSEVNKDTTDTLDIDKKSPVHSVSGDVVLNSPSLPGRPEAFV